MMITKDITDMSREELVERAVDLQDQIDEAVADLGDVIRAIVLLVPTVPALT